MAYSPGLERALRVALDAHAGQARKGVGAVPYIVHPVHVALVLSRWGYADEVVQAGVLHDVVEDCEAWTLQRVGEEFGGEVRDLVDALTEDKSRTWKERKQQAIDDVPSMSESAAAIKAADKLHNLASLVEDLRVTRDPEEVWSTFRGGRDRTIEYSGRLVEALAVRLGDPAASALRDVMAELRALA